MDRMKVKDQYHQNDGTPHAPEWELTELWYGRGSRDQMTYTCKTCGSIKEIVEGHKLPSICPA